MIHVIRDLLVLFRATFFLSSGLAVARSNTVLLLHM